MGVSLPAKPRIIYDQTVSAVSQVDIINLAPFTWLFLEADLTVSAGQGLALRTSTDNGATFNASAGAYQWMHTGSSALSSASDTKITMGDNTLTTARIIHAIIDELTNANQKTVIQHKVLHANPFIYTGIGSRNAAATENAIRLLVDGTGTFSGRITLSGI